MNAIIYFNKFVTFFFVPLLSVENSLRFKYRATAQAQRKKNKSLLKMCIFGGEAILLKNRGKS